MRPSNEYGTPSTNDRLHCEKFEPGPETASQLEVLENGERDSGSTSVRSWVPHFFYNTVYATVLVTIIIMVIGGILLGDHKTSILLGLAVAPGFGLAFAMLELSREKPPHKMDRVAAAIFAVFSMCWLAVWYRAPTADGGWIHLLSVVTCGGLAVLHIFCSFRSRDRLDSK